MRTLDYAVEYCNTKLDTTKKLQKVMEMIMNGSSMTAACRENDIDYLTFRRFLKINFDIKKRPYPEFNANELLTWEDKLMKDIFHDDRCVLPDFDKAFEKATSVLTDRERETLNLIYVEELTFEDVGKYFGVTRERVRQIQEKALRRLRTPSIAKYFLYGAETDIITRYEQQVRELEKEKEQLINRLKNTCIDMESANKKLKEMCVAAEICSSDAISELHIKNHTYTCLARAGYETIKDFKGKKISDILRIRRLGRKSLDDLVTALQTQYGIKLKE